MTFTPEQIEARKCGIHPGVPFDEYKKIDAVNASILLWGRCSAAHMKAAIDGLIEHDSPDLAFGRAFHARTLEPDVFAERFIASGPCSEQLKSGPRKGEPCGNGGAVMRDGQWLCGVHGKGIEPLSPPIEIITPDEAARIDGMNTSVRAHPIISQIRRRGGFETTVLGEIDNVVCKVRFDKLIIEGRPVALDLKKCRLGHAIPHKIHRSVFDYGYHVRAAFYQDVLQSAGGPKDVPYILVYVEEQPPYAVSCVELDDEWREIGRLEYRRLLGVYRHGVATGEWPAYTDEDGKVDVWQSHPPQWVVDRTNDLPVTKDLVEVPSTPDDDIVW